MGNICNGKKRVRGAKDAGGSVRITVDNEEGTWVSAPSAVVQWEQRQQELNEEVLEKMREEFYNRPDNFVLNLIIASVQFYANYTREKAEIRNHIRDREIAFNQKLESSKRTVMYLGGHEEVSGTHILYQPQDEPYMEMPTPLQFFVVRDNVDLYPENEWEELQERQYADLDGPGYRFCTEFSKRHPGYVRLRCVDIIPGVTRSNTYEDIYGFMKPVSESELDPVVDPRPLRRNSIVPSESDENPLPNGVLPQNRKSYSDFEESDDDEAKPPPKEQLMNRRLSGVLPHGYPQGKQIKGLLHGKTLQEGSGNLPNGCVAASPPRQRRLEQRRPSGLFPQVNPEMRRSRLAGTSLDTTDSRALLMRKLASVEEDDEDNDEEDEEQEDGEEEEPRPSPTEVLEEVQDEPTDHQKDRKVILHARLNEGCFINRNIKIKDAKDVYGVGTRSERRTYFSSERHMECCEDEFEDLAKILGKEHLVDTSQRQEAAVVASELMIEEIGPKYSIEFIPTMLLKEWPTCSLEWRLRERKGKRDEKAKVLYKWPTDYNIQEVIQMGCNLVPQGHYNPSEPNRVMKIEWQLQFARAEQILLRSLGHTQIRLLLWVEYLLRDHLGDIPGLHTQHLRYILFWMCEHNFRDWQEQRLGIKLKAYLKTLYTVLSTENLPHYFIKNCNMMECIPQKYLRKMQALVKSMNENLPVYVMHTMHRMRTASDFYPMLNVRKLFNLVTVENFGVELLNPSLAQLGGGQPDPDELERKAVEQGEDVLYSDSEEEREAETKRKLHELRRKRKQDAEVPSPEVEEKKKRPATIRIGARVQRVRDLRAGPVLRLFARHFLAMARASNRHRSYPQAYNYLLLAGNMATLLDETCNCDDAEAIRKKVEQLNTASRGGVQDMLGTSWSVNQQHDLVPNGGPARGSNWKMDKPVSMPPPKNTKVFGVDHVRSANTLRNIESLSGSTLYGMMADDSITTLPTDTTPLPEDNTPLQDDVTDILTNPLGPAGVKDQLTNHKAPPDVLADQPTNHIGFATITEQPTNHAEAGDATNQPTNHTGLADVTDHPITPTAPQATIAGHPTNPTGFSDVKDLPTSAAPGNDVEDSPTSAASPSNVEDLSASTVPPSDVKDLPSTSTAPPSVLFLNLDGDDSHDESTDF